MHSFFLSLLSLLALLLPGTIFSSTLLADEPAAPSPQAAVAPARPNIVFILADDLGVGDLGCYGQKVIQTPHIDQLAAEGMKFTQFYSGSTVCAPSRSTLLTGQHTGHTDIRGNGNFALFETTAPRTLPALLKQAGYHTAMIGKSCTTGSVPKDLNQPATMGFDHFFGVLSHEEAHHYYPPRLYRNGQAIDFKDNHEHEGSDFCHDLYLKEAVTWIEQERSQPFFLLYSAHLPHASLCAPEEFIARYRGKVGQEKEVKAGHYRGTTEPNATFAGMVSRLDWEVGQLMLALHNQGIDEKTLILFASDNGAHSAGGHSSRTFQSNGGLRGEKRDMYEGGIRTPMIARWKSRITPGSTSQHIGAFWDVLPTCCELAGANLPQETPLDGISFAPTLLGQPEAQRNHEYLYWEFFEKNGRRAARWGDYKFVQNDVNTGPGPIEVYDLKADPKEEHDMAKKRPSLTRRALEIFEKAHTASPIERFNFKPPRPALPSEMKDVTQLTPHTNHAS